MTLRKAEKTKTKLRVGLAGTSGSGKTYSALLLAFGLTNDWSKIAVIDTENGSADLYAGLGDYNVITLTAPFSPERYIEAIHECERANMEVIIIDSITHEWDGKGGCLEIYDQLGGRYQDWARITPRHNAFIQAILQSPSHVLTTVRKKQDYAMETVDGKTKVQKLGLKEVTREGFEYELTVAFDLSLKHLASTSKDRTGVFMDKPEFIITPETGKILLDWANSGKEAKNVKEEKTDETPDFMDNVTFDEVMQEEPAKPVGVMCEAKDCGLELTDRVASYSKEKYGHALCLKHQTKYKAMQMRKEQE
jgi:ABC-type dipeptide/oligopeptide/nickel transport system ATPase component